MRPTPRILGLAMLAVLLSACASLRAPPPSTDGALDAASGYAAQSAREAELASQPSWRLVGRVAFGNAGQSASAQIDWTQRGDGFLIELTAPVTGRSWRLEGHAGMAVLSGLDDGPRQGPDAEQLLLEATGWRLPVAQMPRWVRGARGVGPAQSLLVGPDGLPESFAQQGWQLRFPDWLSGTPPLPRRVFASSGEASVRLVVSRWEPLP